MSDGMGGCTVAEAPRELHPSMPVINATGYSDVSKRPVAGSHFVVKPHDLNQAVEAQCNLEAQPVSA